MLNYITAKGFYIYYEDQKIPEAIKKWNVTVLPLSPKWRHKDQSILMKLWEALDKFVLENKPDFKN